MSEQLERQTGLREIEYAGDGCYLGRDSYQVWVFTHDGYEVGARVALPNDGTWDKLRRYADRQYDRVKEGSDG